ncbi:MAG TPA: ABC transporter permease [Gammaproteobacteria bacterium]|nr:ABC transporter permease [Gammaproteobacteria bacterium]
MKYLPLVLAALRRKPARTLLTMISVAVAFLLYGLLDGVTASFDNAIDRLTDASRLRTANRISAAAGLPLAHRARIENVSGVRTVGLWSYFGGYYREPHNSIDAAAVDVDRLETLTDVIVSDEALEAMRRTRAGALIGPELAARYGWKVGDRVTLKTRMWPRKDGSTDWEFDIEGIYALPEGAFPADSNFWINYAYFDEARAFANGTVMGFTTKIDDAQRAGEISAAIDRLFASSSDATLTQSETEFIHAQVDRIGNIDYIVGAIIGAVLFALLFVTGNTMMQSIRERTPELAVLKTYGFGDATLATLVIAESAAVCVSAALLGLTVAAGIFPSVFDAMGIAPLPLEPVVLISGVALAFGLAAVSAAPPLWRARRLAIVDALARR